MGKKQNVVKCYRYFWKDKNGLNVKYITDTNKGHEAFIKLITGSKEIISCYREYVHEVDYTFIGYTENIKQEEKEEKESEKI